MSNRFQDKDSASMQSPCVRNCCLDENDVCLGCGRTLEDILRWRSATDEERESMLVLAKNRRMQRMRERKNIL